MADTFTTNLNLTKPEVGASTDSWGDKLNLNLEALDAVFNADGTGTSVGLNIGAGKTLNVAGTANLTGGGSLGGSFSGSPTFSGNPTFSGAVSLGGGGALAGTFSGTPTFSGALTFNGTPVFGSGSINIRRADAVSEGAQIELCRASDNATAWSIDVFGSTESPELRFISATGGHVATLTAAGAFNVVGPLTVPAGASGAQAPQAQEIPSLLGITGQVAFFARSSAPAGWLKANGATVSRTTYAALFAAIGTTFGAGDGSTTFRLPDLRGQFLRGWDDGRGVDSGRVFGSDQTDEIKSHTHTVPYRLGNGSVGFDGTAITGNTGTGSLAIFNGIPGASASGGAETRPRNIALLACIKF